MSWSHEQVSALIELYRERPVLFAVKSQIFKNKHAKVAAFNEIELELKKCRPSTNIQEIKAKFTSLRNNFQAEVRKIKASKASGAGEDNVYQTTLWYFDQMLFVQEHNNPRPAFDSMESPEPESIIYAVQDLDSSQDDEQCQLVIEDSLMVCSTQETPRPPKKIHSTSLDSRPSSTEPSKKKNKKKNSEDAVLGEICGAITCMSDAVANQIRETQPKPAKTQEDIFGELVASKLKDIAEINLRNSVQCDIFSLLCKSINNQ